MKSYVTIPNFRLRELCIKQNWFTCGTCEQYDKLFLMNESESGFSANDVITAIWLCSDEKWDCASICRIIRSERLRLVDDEEF